MKQFTLNTEQFIRNMKQFTLNTEQFIRNMKQFIWNMEPSTLNIEQHSHPIFFYINYMLKRVLLLCLFF